MPYVELEDVKLYYEEIGVGEPVIFLHNAFSRGILAFSAQVSVLQETCRCILPDLRGHGRTLCGDLNWTVPQLADDVVKLMDKLHISKANIIGFSMGGGVALHMAARHPERIRSLITIGAAGCVTDGIRSNADNFQLHILDNEEDENFINLLVNNHQDAHKGDWRTFAETSVANWRRYPDISSDDLERFNFPCMFISGANDTSIKKEHIEKLAAGVKDGTAKVIEGCGHGPHLVNEKPMLMNKLMLEFLQKKGKGRG